MSKSPRVDFHPKRIAEGDWPITPAKKSARFPA
jgi:hypothetical protein